MNEDPMSDLWTFPNRKFDEASNALAHLIDRARTTRNRALIRRIRRCWTFDRFGRGTARGERWRDILRKVDMEGSVWVVWWHDGVENFLRYTRRSA